MDAITITSRDNPRFKLAVKLRDRRTREKEKLFLIEGFRELKRAHTSGQPFQTFFYCPELFLGENEDALIAEIDAPKIRCSEKIFRSLSYRDRPDGLLAIAPMQKSSLEQLQGSFFVIAESIEKPGNLGTILRSSDAAGVDGVIICDRCTDLYNPNVVRSSVGTLFTLPVVEATKQDTMHWLAQRDVKLVAATPHAQAIYDEVDLLGPLAIVVGCEQYGLSQEWMKIAHVHVRIPMLGEADSLNVSVATTLLLYEVIRQRKSSGYLLR